MSYHFIIDLNVADFDCDSLIEFCSDFMINLSYGSWYNTSVLVLSATASHSESLSSTSLSIAHYSAIIPLDNR